MSNARDFIFSNGLNEKRDFDKDKSFISDITIERVNRAGEKILKEKGELAGKIDIGYKVFSLVPKPELKKEDEFYLVHTRTTQDKLYNMLATRHKELTIEINEIEKDKLYLIDNDYYVLGECNIDKIEDTEQSVFIDGYGAISLGLMENIKCKLKTREQLEVIGG